MGVFCSGVPFHLLSIPIGESSPIERELVLVTDYIAYGDAFVLGWVVVDYAANVILSKGETYTKIKYFGSRFVSRDKAIVLSLAQILIAMFVSFWIVDWIFAQIALFYPALIPITLIIAGIFYLYVLAGLPYNITVRRALPSIAVIALGIVINCWPQIARMIAENLHMTP